jgi:hypothetical protein
MFICVVFVAKGNTQVHIYTAVVFGISEESYAEDN